MTEELDPVYCRISYDQVGFNLVAVNHPPNSRALDIIVPFYRNANLVLPLFRSLQQTAAELLNVSAKAQERVRLRDAGYVRVTAQNAADAVERGRVRGRG